MRIFLSICSLLLTACHTADQPAAETLETGWYPILTQNRRFVYAARWYAPGATTATLDTVVLTAFGKPLRWYPPQMAYEWLFRHIDTTATSGPKEVVGAFDRPNKFWLHPPRNGHYSILELNPFPDIQLPATVGAMWTWPLDVGSHYANPAWAEWQGNLHIDYRYQLADSTLLPTPLGRLPCYRVQATGTSKLGATALESYFNAKYGFVRLNYQNIDHSRLELELVSVTSRPVLDRAIFSKHL